MQCRDEDGNEDQEKKREWLKEKNNEEEEETEGNTGGDNDDPTTEGSKKLKKDTSKFAGLPSGYLHCFVCDKSMWDGESFQNHIRGLHVFFSFHPTITNHVYFT